MIELYYWTTPNGHKITIFLEEAEIPYTIHPVNIGRGEQFKPGVFGDLAEQPYSGDHRPRSGRRRRAYLRLRIRRDLDLSRRKNWKVPPARFARPHASTRMVVLAGWQPRSHGRAESSFQAICARKDYLRDRALRE